MGTLQCIPDHTWIYGGSLRKECGRKSKREMIGALVLNSQKTRAVPDLLLRNPAGAVFCRICKANPAGAGAGFHHIISHQYPISFKF